MHHLLKYVFGNGLCCMLISLSNVSIFLQNGHFQPILAAIFVTIAKIKIESIPDFYPWFIALIIRYEETTEKQLFFFFASLGGGGGANSLLKHVALCL